MLGSAGPPHAAACCRSLLPLRSLRSRGRQRCQQARSANGGRSPIDLGRAPRFARWYTSRRPRHRERRFPRGWSRSSTTTRRAACSPPLRPFSIQTRPYVYNLRRESSSGRHRPDDGGRHLLAAAVGEQGGGSELATFFGNVASMKRPAKQSRSAEELTPSSATARGDSDRREGVLVAAPEGHQDAGRDERARARSRFISFRPTRASRSRTTTTGAKPWSSLSLKFITANAAARGSFGPSRRHVQNARTRSATIISPASHPTRPGGSRLL
jgi:hypothetical protein